MRGLDETGMQRREQHLHIGFEIIKIDQPERFAPLLFSDAAEGQRRNPHRLRDTRDAQFAVLHVRCAQEYAPEFEDPHARGFAIDVVARVIDQATNEAGAHDAHLTGDRIKQSQRRGVGSEVRFPGFGDEAEIDHFLEISISEQQP